MSLQSRWRHALAVALADLSALLHMLLRSEARTREGGRGWETRPLLLLSAQPILQRDSSPGPRRRDMLAARLALTPQSKSRSTTRSNRSNSIPSAIAHCADVLDGEADEVKAASPDRRLASPKKAKTKLSKLGVGIRCIQPFEEVDQCRALSMSPDSFGYSEEAASHSVPPTRI